LKLETEVKDDEDVELSAAERAIRLAANQRGVGESPVKRLARLAAHTDGRGDMNRMNNLFESGRCPTLSSTVIPVTKI
jgi:hypothetical protein